MCRWVVVRARAWLRVSCELVGLLWMQTASAKFPKDFWHRSVGETRDWKRIITALPGDFFFLTMWIRFFMS
jgi:hypothetical protein